MRRSPYVLLGTVAATGALVGFHPRKEAAPASPATASPATTTATATATATTTATTGKSSQATSAGGTAGARAYTGSVEPNRYGDVQVRITVSGGKLTDVTALQLPQNDPRSSQISSYAAPTLREEALQAQGASIDAVSGASYTSAGYVASLRSALSRAGL